MDRKAVFLDLNGTLVLPLKQERLDDLYPIPGAIVAVARLGRAGFVCPVITVQSRIAKGLFTAAEFRDWFREFAAAASLQGAELKGPYVCPHRYAELCDCKKPNILLYEQAIRDLGLSVAAPSSSATRRTTSERHPASARGAALSGRAGPRTPIWSPPSEAKPVLSRHRSWKPLTGFSR